MFASGQAAETSQRHKFTNVVSFVFTDISYRRLSDILDYPSVINRVTFNGFVSGQNLSQEVARHLPDTQVERAIQLE
jgi:hypothetical protein